MNYEELIQDWKGNIITGDDTILVIRYKKILFKVSYGTVLIDHSTENAQIVEFKRDETQEIKVTYCWELIGELKVHKLDEKDFRVYIQQGNFYTDLSTFIAFDLPEDCIICIKGKSDNEQDYFNEYFKAHL